jgi:hypothetical protein
MLKPQQKRLCEGDNVKVALGPQHLSEIIARVG